MHVAKLNKRHYLTVTRTGKRLRRRAKQIDRANRLRASITERIKAFGRRSKIVRLLGAKATSELVPKGKSLDVKVVRNFSLIDNPSEVLSLICSLAASQRGHRPSNFWIDFQHVDSHDLGAHTVLDVVVDEIAAEAKLYSRKLKWSGTYPANDSIRRLIQSLGIIRQLKITHEYPKPAEASALTIFEYRCKHYTRQRRPERIDIKGLVTAKFADHINHCLGKVGKELAPAARATLCGYLGEVIENAEVHAGMVDWMVHGYLDASLEVPTCEIVILNFGQSFAETLESLDAQSFTRKQIQPYLDAHGRESWFGPSWRRQDLLTLVALQGNVSCRNTDEDCTRGQGMADLIEFFQRVHNECKGSSGRDAKMTIISGSTRVLFDGKYRMAEDESGTRIIAFNASNDLKKKPDAAYVIPLDSAFLPGTVIGIQFPLARESLIDVKGAPNE